MMTLDPARDFEKPLYGRTAVRPPQAERPFYGRAPLVENQNLKMSCIHPKLYFTYSLHAR